MTHLRIALLSWITALAPAASAQTPPFSEQISVELVNVEVHVVDRDGHSLEGLPREAFRLFDGDQPVEISHFAWVPRVAPNAGARGEAAPGEGPVQPRRLAVFFDELQVGDHSRRPLLDALRERLSAGLQPDDLVTVVRFDGANLETLLPWSSDRRKLARALDALDGYTAQRIIVSQELRSWISSIRQSIEDVQFCNNTGLMVRAYSDVVKRHVEASATTLMRYAQRLAHEPGRRLLLHVSDGIPMIAGGDVHQWASEMCDGTALVNGVPGAQAVFFDSPAVDGNTRDRWNPDQSRLEFAEYSNAELWRNVAARVNALGITVYPVLAAESEQRFASELMGGTMTATARSNVRQNARDTLSFLAQATGGLMLDATSGQGAQLDRFLGDLGGYYSLAFTPRASGTPGVRRIRVEVDRDGVDLRYRQSYRMLGRDERVATQLAEVFEAERVDNPLQLRLDVRRVEGSADRRLRLLVPFDQLSLIDSPEGGQEGRFTVYVAIRRENGRVLNPRQRSIVARRADPRALAYTYEIALPDDRGQVAVAVFDEYSGNLAFARERLVTR